VLLNAVQVTGGTVQAVGPGAVISLAGGAVLSSPIIAATAGGVIQVTASNTALLDATGATIALGGPLLVNDNASLILRGTFSNMGTVTEASLGNATDIQINGALVSLKGGGIIAMGDRPSNRIYATSNGFELINVDNTITGSGQIGVGSGLVLDNQSAGTIVSSWRVYARATRISCRSVSALLARFINLPK